MFVLQCHDDQGEVSAHSGRSFLDTLLRDQKVLLGSIFIDARVDKMHEFSETLSQQTAYYSLFMFVHTGKGFQQFPYFSPATQEPVEG